MSNCDNNAGWAQMVHNQCLERKPPCADMASWNKDCCAQTPCAQSASQCAPAYQGPVSLADSYADANKKVNPKYSHGGVGVL
jgi:hypothetical protein